MKKEPCLPEQVSYLIRMMNNESSYQRKLIFKDRLQEISTVIQLELDNFEKNNVFSQGKKNDRPKRKE